MGDDLQTLCNIKSLMMIIGHTKQSKLIPPLGIRVLPLFEDFKIDLGVVDNVTVSDTPS